MPVCSVYSMLLHSRDKDIIAAEPYAVRRTACAVVIKILSLLNRTLCVGPPVL